MILLLLLLLLLLMLCVQCSVYMMVRKIYAYEFPRRAKASEGLLRISWTHRTTEPSMTVTKKTLIT